MGKKFADIDPQMVEDIDAYIEYADQMYEALRASRIKGLEVDFSQAANLAEMSDFYDEAIANQNKILKKEMIAKYQELGLTEDMSIEEIREIVNAIEGNEVVEGKEKEILSFIPSESVVIELCPDRRQSSPRLTLVDPPAFS